MRLLSRLEAERKSGAIWYVLFRQSPKELGHRHFDPDLVGVGPDFVCAVTDTVTVPVEAVVVVPVVSPPFVVIDLATFADQYRPEIVFEAVAQDEMAASLAVEADSREVVGDAIVDHRDAVDRMGRRIGHQANHTVNDFIAFNQRRAAFLAGDAGAAGVHGMHDGAADHGRASIGARWCSQAGPLSG